MIGLAYVEREPEPYDIENEARWTTTRCSAGSRRGSASAGGRRRIAFTYSDGFQPGRGCRRLDAPSGKVDGTLICEGFVASRHIERLAARVPVVVIAGTPREREADVVAVKNFSGSVAIINHLIAEHGRRRLSLSTGRRTRPTPASGGAPSTMCWAATRTAS